MNGQIKMFDREIEQLIFHFPSPKRLVNLKKSGLYQKIYQMMIFVKF